MARASLLLFLVFGLAVPVSRSLFKGTFPTSIKISPNIGIVGEYVNITCENSSPTDNIPMEINGKLVNATKISDTTVWFSLHSEKKQKFHVVCGNHFSVNAREIDFGYKADFNYALERNIDRNILLFITPTIKGNNEYWNIICEHSKEKMVWSNCSKTLMNNTSYMFITDDWMFFRFNLSSSNKYSVVNKIVIKRKDTIPIRFPQLPDIKFQSLPPADPFQQNFEVKIITTSRWEMNPYNLTYEIKYWSEFDDPRFAKTLYYDTKTIILEKLSPYTRYNVIARVKRTANGLWNPPFKTNFRTNTAPSNPPKTTNGTYYLWNCTETGLDKCIVLYWEKVPRKLANGEIIGYCVQIIDENNLSNHCQDPRYLTRNSLYKEFQDLPPNKALTFSIKAVNNDKRKPQSTIIQVGKTVPKGPKAVFVIEVAENLYNVSWLLHPHQENSNVTVFFCRNKDISTPHIYCIDDVKWEKAANENYLLVNNSVKPLVFAAYVNTKEGMSPLTKAECIFNPGKPTKPKQPEILESEKKLTVLWPEFTCENLNGIPVAYEILYNMGKKCENGSKKQFKPIGIKPPESSFVIQSLHPKTNYTLCIRVTTESYSSLMSDAVTVETKALPVNKNNTPAIVGGLIGALAFIGLIAAIIFGIMKYKKGKEAIDIELPDQNNETLGKSNSSYCHDYASIENKDTKEHHYKENGIPNSISYMKVEFDSNDNDTSANTTTSLVSAETTPTSANDGEYGNQEEHQKVQDKSVDNVNFENPENFDMKHLDNLSNFAGSDIKETADASTGNVDSKDSFSMKQEAVNNLTKNHSGDISENIELNNMPGCPGYVIVGDHSLSPQTSTDNSNDLLLPGKDSDSLGYPTNNDMLTTNTSDLSFSMLQQTQNESFEEEEEEEEEEDKDSKSYNTGYVTADYTKAIEDSESKVMPECVSNDKHQQIPTDYVLENFSPSHQILTI